MILSTRNKARLSWVFRGADGIRAGWSILIFLLALVVPGTLINLFGKFVLHLTPSKALDPWHLIIGEAVMFALILAATAFMAWIERRPVLSYGLAVDRAAAHYLAGWVGGFLCLSALIGALAAAGCLVFDGAALHGLAVLGYGLAWLVAFTLVGCAEEALFRGYLQSTLTRGMGFWPGALLMSVLFGAAHIKNNGESVLGIAGVVMAGLVFCLLLRVSGSLWLGIGFHAAWDWAQSSMYGTPDSGYPAQHHWLNTHAAGNVLISGGSAGPEGSTLAGPVMIMGLLALLGVCRWAGLFASKDGSQQGWGNTAWPPKPPVRYGASV
jgi:membrane protease YdiL (CAAX protease family)